MTATSLTWVNSIGCSPSHAASVGARRHGAKQMRWGHFPMAVHKKILEWQADHPNITWIGWGIVWAIVLSLLFWPSKALH